MSFLIYHWLLLQIVFVNCIRIPFIQNSILIPRCKWNGKTLTNYTKDQCLCTVLALSSIAFNWFPYNTCQLFDTFPISYKIQSAPQARLYLPQGLYPNASQCCMPDINYLLDKLKNGTWTSVNVQNPRNLVLDNHGYIVTTQYFGYKLVRFNSINLTMTDQISLNITITAPSIAFLNNTYFVGLENGPIRVIDSETLTLLNTISISNVQKLFGMILLNNGQTMVLSSRGDHKLVFYQRTDDISFNYTFAYQQSLNYSSCYGLTYYNDTYFYAASYESKQIYSYSAIENSTLWNESLVVDASSLSGVGSGTFMSTDECGRYWFSSLLSTVQIFNSSGSWIGSFNLTSGKIIHTLITDNYVIYFSDWTGRIIRIDPNLEF